MARDANNEFRSFKLVPHGYEFFDLVIRLVTIIDDEKFFTKCVPNWSFAVDIIAELWFPVVCVKCATLFEELLDCAIPSVDDAIDDLLLKWSELHCLVSSQMWGDDIDASVAIMSR